MLLMISKATCSAFLFRFVFFPPRLPCISLGVSGVIYIKALNHDSGGVLLLMISLKCSVVVG